MQGNSYFKIEKHKDFFKVIKVSNGQNGSLRTRNFNLYRDKNGFYIGEGNKKTYLTSENCINLFDF